MQTTTNASNVGSAAPASMRAPDTSPASEEQAAPPATTTSTTTGPPGFGKRYRDMITATEHGVLSGVEGLAEHSTYKDSEQAKGTVSASLLKRISKELKSLKKELLLSARNSMFVRFDEDRPQFMRAVLSGNRDSPFAHGCFLFDIFLPPDYPAVPPMIKHITPGADQVKANNGPGGFSPNMHKSTGKICLSLLGTWDGPGWDPEASNLYQVLSTILFAILAIEHPYYMEPDYGGWEGTAPKTDHGPKVIEYDEEIQRGTVKYAILGPLTKPWEGFEEVLRVHFSLKKHRIMRSFYGWKKDAKHKDHEAQLAAFETPLIDALRAADSDVKKSCGAKQVFKSVDTVTSTT